MFTNGRKRSINSNKTESDSSENYDTEEELTQDIKEKISKVVSENNIKQCNTSSMNEQFQNYQFSKMAMSDEQLQGRQKKSYTEYGRREKICFSKNALIARENRLKKKLYIENLEKSVEHYKNVTKKLYSRLNIQAHYIKNITKEVEYFKSIIANSKDITKLLKCVNLSTGMPIRTSINKNINLIDSVDDTHPWSETNNSVFDFDNGELFNSDYNLNHDLNWDNLFSDLNSPLMSDESATPFEDLLRIPDQESIETSSRCEEKEDISKGEPFSEHNYTARSPVPTKIDSVGICLHVSNHKVSLEFCPHCSEKALSVWEET